MGQRLPIIIYKIPISQVSDLNKQFTKPSSNYLINIYDINITTDFDSDNTNNISKKIFITDDNFTPSENIQNSGGWYEVFYNGEDSYIKFRGSIYYIPKTSTDLSSLNSQEIYEFYVKPDRITPSFKKLQTVIRTLGGWETQHWGNQLVELSVEGKTGGLHLVTKEGSTGEKRVLNSQEGIMDSIAWKKLVSLRKIYEEDQNRRNKQAEYLLGLSYLDGLYIGYFIDFTGPIPEADKPYIMNYRFSFKVQETIYDSGNISIPGDN